MTTFSEEEKKSMVQSLVQKFSLNEDELELFQNATNDYKLVYLYQRKNSEEAYFLLWYFYNQLTIKYENIFDLYKNKYNLICEQEFQDLEEEYFKTAILKEDLSKYHPEDYLFLKKLRYAYKNILNKLVRTKKSRTVFQPFVTHNASDGNGRTENDIPDERSEQLFLNESDDAADEDIIFDEKKIEKDFYESLDPESIEAKILAAIKSESEKIKAENSNRKLKFNNVAESLGIKDIPYFSKKIKELKERFEGYKISILLQKYEDEKNPTIKAELWEEICLKRKNLVETWLNEVQKTIWMMYQKNPKIRQTEICKVLGKKDYAVSREVAHLKRMHLI